MADKKENVQLKKTIDKAEQEKLESVKKAVPGIRSKDILQKTYKEFINFTGKLLADFIYIYCC